MHHPKKLFGTMIPDGGRRAVGNVQDLFEESYGRGAEVVSDTLKACVKDGRVGVFATWGLSDDNASKRSADEISILNKIFLEYLRKLRLDLATPQYQAVKVVHMGNPTFIHPDVAKGILEVTDFTKDRAGELLFGLGLGYGAHDEADRAVDLRTTEKLREERGERGVEEKPIGNWKDYLDLPFRSGNPYQYVDLMYRTGTDPTQAYTSAYLFPYEGPKTQLRFNPAYLPDTTADDFMQHVEEVWTMFHGEKRPRAGA